MLRTHIRQAVTLFIVLTVITGIIYPLLVTGIAQNMFHHQANGSLIMKDGNVLGSSLIGQQFDDPKYFFGRLSATSPAYNASLSSGSNLGPLNPALIDNIKARISVLKNIDPNNDLLIPVDLVTSSASGLDPDISIASAYYQMNRIARLRVVPIEKIKALIDQHIQGRLLGVIGQPVVNVMELNLALDVK